MDSTAANLLAIPSLAQKDFSWLVLMPKDILKWGPLRMPNLVYFFLPSQCWAQKRNGNRQVSFVGFSQDVQFELFGGQKFQIERLEKTCGGSIPGGSWENPASFLCWIFSRRPIWAFWGPKIPNRASWEKSMQARFPAGLGSVCLIESDWNIMW